MKSADLGKIVETIVRSPAIARCNIGITLNSAARRSGYLGVGFDHFILLDFDLSCKVAMAKERALHTLLTTSKKSGVCYRKYRENARKTYYPSLGGLQPDDSRKYDLYLAWWNVGSKGYRS